MTSIEDINPGEAPLVQVEWLDIATSIGGGPGLVRRWTDGRLLSVDYWSENIPCVVIGNTWDEDGWSDYTTFPVSVVANIDELREALENGG